MIHIPVWIRQLLAFLHRKKIRIQFFLFSLFFVFINTVAFASETLIIEPDNGRAPLLDAIKKAQSNINLVIYGFTDNEIIQGLIQARILGKNVRVLLEPYPYRAENENNFAIKKLTDAHITLRWANTHFKLTHQKTFIFDNQRAIIMTFNLTRSSFKNERNFALIIDDPAEIEEIKRVFIADWQNQHVNLTHPNLIWSPNSRKKILELINQAQFEINIYAQNLTDYKIIGALANAAKKGKLVNILLSAPQNRMPNRKIHFLEKSGVHVRYSNSFIIHAKVIIIDKKTALLGSINLTSPSLEDNRELSIITHDSHTIKQLLSTFEHDWAE